MAAEKYAPDATNRYLGAVPQEFSRRRSWQCLSLRRLSKRATFSPRYCARAIPIYGPNKRAESEKAVQLVRAGSKGSAENNEDRAFQLLGWSVASGSREVIQKLGRELLALQRSDGGWGQLPSLDSDAMQRVSISGVKESRAAGGDQPGLPTQCFSIY